MASMMTSVPGALVDFGAHKAGGGNAPPRFSPVPLCPGISLSFSKKEPRPRPHGLFATIVSVRQRPKGLGGVHRSEGDALLYTTPVMMVLAVESLDPAYHQ
jgi:hypothetical protein